MTAPIRLPAKDALIEAAFAVLSRDPSAALSQVADRAGVGRATLHRHFASRHDLIRALALIAIAEMDTVAEKACDDAGSHTDALRLMLAALIPLGDRHGFLAREPIEDDPEIAAAFARQTEAIGGIIEEAKREGAFDPGVPSAWIAQGFDYLLQAAWDSVKAGEITNAQAAGLAWRTLTTGLRPATGLGAPTERGLPTGVGKRAR